MQPLGPGDPRTAGEFRLSAQLGRGGMGQVYLGYSPAGRAVAVKICHPELAADPAFVQRFAREATAAQAVNGLYTAQVVAAGPYDSPPWMATAYVPGPSLSDYVRGYGPLPGQAAWRLAAGLAEALLAVHASGLVHRDLKPSNVLLAVDGPRVIDFGIASALEVTSLTTAGSVMGSPPYMSPEQAMGKPAGSASDVFSLGCTLAFAASGAPPFGDGDAPALLFRVVHMTPALDSVPERLRAVVAACLAKDPAARPTLPQLLRDCQDGATAGGNSAASFWPSQMTAAIARQQASLESAPPDETVPPGWQVLTAGRPGPQPPTASPGASTRQSPLGLTSTRVASAVGRRPVLSALGGLVVAGGLAAAGWELASSGGGKAAATTTAGRTTGTRVAWVHQADGQLRSGPAISADGATLYIGSGAGTVYALDAASGRQAGTFPVGGAVSGVTVALETLFAGSADGKVRAFNIGNQGWSWTSRPAGSAIAGAPMWGGDVVYAGSDDHYLYAFDQTNGQLKWRAASGGTAMASQPTGTGVVWVGSQDRSMYVLSTSSGKVVKKLAVGGPVDSAPVTVTGQVWVGTGEGGLWNLYYDEFTKAINVNWKFQADGAITGTPVPAANGDTVFVATARGTVYAVGSGVNTGQASWSCHVGGPVRSGLALYNGMVYAGSDDGYLYAIDISTGTVSWKYKAGGPIQSALLIKGGLVYFGSLDRRVYALRA